jgi:hypothetical protein
MTVLHAHTRARPPAGDDLVRDALRAQVARLDAELATYPVRVGATRARRPHLLGLAELERVRDDLVERVHAARVDAAERERSEQAARERLEAMLADPAAYVGERVRLSELGLPGCGSYRVRPRLGLLGMLRGWWVVKLSSGCPLSGALGAIWPSGRRRGRRPPIAPRSTLTGQHLAAYVDG